MAKWRDGNDGRIGIRVTKEDYSKKKCERFKMPIDSTSANISGQKAPKNYNDNDEIIKSSGDYIVKYRQEKLYKNKPSSIIKLESGGVIKIIRK